MTMKVIAPPVAELLARLHDSAADVAKFIEAIPALKSDDLPQIVNRMHMLGQLKKLEAEFPANKVPSDNYLRARVQLLRAHEQALDDTRLPYTFQLMSNKQLATRVELLRKVGANRLNDWTDLEVDEAIAELQCERRQRKRNAKTAQAEAAKPSAQIEGNQEIELEELEEVEEVEEVEDEDIGIDLMT
jgi:hypothetical protein